MYSENNVKDTVLKVVIPSKETYTPTYYSDALTYLSNCIDKYQEAERYAGNAFAAAIENENNFYNTYGVMEDVQKNIEELKAADKNQALVLTLEKAVEEFNKLNDTLKAIQTANENAMEVYRRDIIPNAITFVEKFI